MDAWWKICCPRVVLITLIVGSHGAFVEEYMTGNCNKGLERRPGGRFETSTALTYDNLMNCYTVLKVTQGKDTMLFFRRFDLEDKIQGQCVDYLNIHKGSSSASPRANSEPMCGVVQDVFNMSIPGSEATFYFRSDSSAVYRGFEVLYIAYSQPPCSAGEFLCSTNICIDTVLRCDTVDQCGDGSDEMNCDVEEQQSAEAGMNLALIVGCSLAGAIVIALLGYAIYRAYDYYRWRVFVRIHGENRDWNVLYQYPVTDKYNIHEIGKKGRRDPDIRDYCHEGPAAISRTEGGKYLDEA